MMRKVILSLVALFLLSLGVFGGNLLAGAIGLAPTGGEEVGLLTSDPANSDSTSAVSPRSNFTVAQARAFADFDVVWLGDEFDGLPLSAVLRADYDAYVRPGVVYRDDSITFLYGTCAPPDKDGGCAAPYQVIVESACQRPKGMAAAHVLKGDAYGFRGALAQGFADGHVQMWTGRSSITVFGPDSERTLEAAASLLPLSQSGQGSAGDLAGPVPVSDLDCPPLSPAKTLESGWLVE